MSNVSDWFDALVMANHLPWLAFKFAPQFWLSCCYITLLCCLLARMENSVLGNALEGVPEESEGEEQPADSKIESADNLDGKDLLFPVLVIL